jgi:hypothetical protein
MVVGSLIQHFVVMGKEYDMENRHFGQLNYGTSET